MFGELVVKFCRRETLNCALTHSTRIRSCCFILSHTSFMLANCLFAKSSSVLHTLSNIVPAFDCLLSISAFSSECTDRPLPGSGSSVLGRRQLIRSRSFCTAAKKIYVSSIYIFSSRTTSLTFFLHASLKAFPQSTITTLVPLILIDDTISRESACVQMILAHATAKESFTAVTRRSSVVFAGCSIATNCARCGLIVVGQEYWRRGISGRVLHFDF